MKIGAVQSVSPSVNFGRALGKTELNEAGKTIKEARALQGFDDYKGVFVLPKDKLPDLGTDEAKSGVKRFYEFIKNIFGVNMVEITGEGYDEEALKIARDSGLETVGSFGLDGTIEKMEKSAGEAAEKYLKEHPDADKKTLDMIKQNGRVEAIKGDIENALGENAGLKVVVSDTGKVTKEQLDAFETAVSQNGASKKVSLFWDHGKQGGYDFKDGGKIASKFKGKTLISSAEHADSNWGSVDFLTQRMGAKQGEFIHGTSHIHDDGKSLISQLKDNEQLKKGLPYYRKTLGVSEEIYGDTVEGFAALKNAEVMRSKNFYKNFDDVNIIGDVKNVLDFEPAYYKAVQTGDADNVFHSLSLLIKDGEVKDKVKGFSNVLYAQGATSEKELEGLSKEVLEGAYKDVLPEMRTQEQIAKANLKAAKEKIEPLSSHFDKGMNFLRKNKTAAAAIGFGALFAIGYMTLRSLNKEVAQKVSERKPVVEPRLDKKV